MVMWGRIVAASNRLNIITSYKFWVDIYFPYEQLVASVKNIITVAKCMSIESVKEKMIRFAWWYRIFIYSS